MSKRDILHSLVGALMTLALVQFVIVLETGSRIGWLSMLGNSVIAGAAWWRVRDYRAANP